jgi:porin
MCASVARAQQPAAPAPSFRADPKAFLQSHGVDVGFSWAQFGQGVAAGDPADASAYGGRVALTVTLDGERLGLWRGFSVSALGEADYGDALTPRPPLLLPTSAAMLFPAVGDQDADVSLTLNQRFGDRATLRVGKINLMTVLNSAPLVGGGGLDTFMHATIATPISGITPPYILGAIVNVTTQPLRYTVMIYDPRNAQSSDVLKHPFDEGVVLSGAATRLVPIGGRLGTHTLRVAYSTRTGVDLRDIPELFPPGSGTLGTKEGSYYLSYTFTQNLVQRSPSQSWGLFGQLGFSDSNPNPIGAHGYLGVGGSGLFASRPRDRFGASIFWLSFSDELRQPLNALLGAGLRGERGVELFYNYAATPWLGVTWDLQFIRPGLPGGTAMVPGVRVELRF